MRLGALSEVWIARKRLAFAARKMRSFTKQGYCVWLDAFEFVIAIDQDVYRTKFNIEVRIIEKK